jgi:predicted nucleotidyltransferase
MVDISIRKVVRKYIEELNAADVPVFCAVIFGSYANGENTAWSDIDLLIVSPKFDGLKDRSDISLIWKVAARVDSRIEPLPCGVRQWENDDSSGIIEIARRMGEIIRAA